MLNCAYCIQCHLCGYCTYSGRVLIDARLMYGCLYVRKAYVCRHHLPLSWFLCYFAWYVWTHSTPWSNISSSVLRPHAEKNGSLGLIVYSCLTHTNLYLNSSRPHHPSNKRAVHSTLVHSAGALCDQDSFHAELVFLGSIHRPTDSQGPQIFPEGCPARRKTRFILFHVLDRVDIQPYEPGSVSEIHQVWGPPSHENIKTHRPIARQQLNKHIPRRRIRNNRGHPFLGNGYVFSVVRTNAM
jgi:hypothetical protein